MHVHGLIRIHYKICITVTIHVLECIDYYIIAINFDHIEVLSPTITSHSYL